MYARYLRRELAGRKKQTVIVASGLAIAIALVMIVNSLAAGVRDAQAQALESVYGVGTDLTVTGAQAEPGEGTRGQQFDFDEDAGATDEEGTTSIEQSQLTTEMFRSTLDASVLDTVLAADGVEAATGTLSLTNTTFSGEVGQAPAESPAAEEGTAQAPPEGGAGGGGFGGGAFGLDSFTVMGIEPDAAAIGPLSSVTVTDGRGLESADAGAAVAVIDASYATTAELAVGDTMEIAGEEFEVVGVVASTSDEADTAANAYIPLDVAQDLSGVGDVLSTVYVQASSSEGISAVQAEIEEALPDATVSSQSDLASTVSGSLSSASALITNLGTWLSVIVLAVALALAVLFTISGVSRRTREFGTLKAIGWSNGRVVGQVAGESVVQSLIGGVAGLVVGLLGIGIINIVSPTISTTAGTTAAAGPGGAAGGGPGGQAFGQAAAQTATEIVLQAPVTLWVVGAAIGLAIIGGLLAGAFGGWRAARLSPAEALRSVG